jgi:hypothetical protein
LSGQVDHLNLTGIHCRREGIEIGLGVRGQIRVAPAGSVN